MLQELASQPLRQMATAPSGFASRLSLALGLKSLLLDCALMAVNVLGHHPQPAGFTLNLQSEFFAAACAGDIDHAQLARSITAS
jgi:hypothetical protein